MNMRSHFLDEFGTYDMSNSDIAQAVFKSGWNSALREAASRVASMPFEKDTQDSFAAWLKEMQE
jgi:hypothetical protein